MILLSSFVFGLIFGSFLNVVIYRLNPALQLKSGVFGRSVCPNCRTQLKWHDLIPILSFIWLRGVCRYCQKKISWQYPIVEILSGFIWVGVFYKFFGSLGFEIRDFFRISDFGFRILDSIYYIFVFSVLLVVAVYDFKWRIIPDKIVYPAIAAVFIYNFFKFLNLEIFIYSFFTAFIAFLFFFFIYFFSKGRAMGLGDAKLAFLIGLFLSPFMASIAFMLSFVIGAVFGILLIVYKKKSWKNQIAFGPFLVLGVFIAFFFSDFVIKLFQP